MIIKEAPQRFDPVTIRAERLVRLGPEKPATISSLERRAERRSDVWVVASQTGDDSGIGWLTGMVESRHVSRLPRTSAVHQSHVRVVRILGDIIGCAFTLTVAARAQIPAVRAFEARTLRPHAGDVRRNVNQMASAAGTRLLGGFTYGVLYVGRRGSQIVKRSNESSGFGVTDKANTRVRSRRCKQLRSRTSLVNVMAGYAQNLSVSTQGHILR